MPRAFDCPSCGERIVTYLRDEEVAACAGCGGHSPVPADAEPTEARPPPRESHDSGPEPAPGPPRPLSAVAWVLLSVPVAGILLLAGLVETRAGHGTYHLLKLVFPVPLLAGATARAPAVFLTLAAVQFPLGALLLHAAFRKGRGWSTAGVFLSLHLLVSILVYLVSHGW